jgi:hypothetical protein
MKVYREYLWWIILPMTATFCLVVAGGGILLWSKFFVDPVQIAYADYRSASEETIKAAEEECARVNGYIKKLQLTLTTLPPPLPPEDIE